MDDDDVIAQLTEACQKAGSQKDWADAAGVSAAYVSDVLKRKRAPGLSILLALGLRRVTVYEPQPAAPKRRRNGGA